MDAADNVGFDKDSNSIDSIVLPAERRAPQTLERESTRMRKVGAVWATFRRTVKEAWMERAVRLNAIPLSGFLLHIPEIILTLVIEYSLKK